MEPERLLSQQMKPRSDLFLRRSQGRTNILNHDLVTDFCFLGGWVCKIEIMEFLKYIVYQTLKILRRNPQVLYYSSN